MIDLRRQILDASRLLLIEQGYSNLSLRKIASQIGCSPTAIYLYFENRDALVHALMDEGFEMLAARLEQAAESVSSDPIEWLRKISWEYIAYGLENPEYYEIMFMLNPKDLARFPTEKYRRASRSMDPFIKALTSAVGRREVSVVDPRRFANIVWATMHGGIAIVLAKRLDVRIDRVLFLQSLLANCLAGLALPEAAGVMA